MNQSNKDGLSIIVVGASGDLARRKIYPALFSLYCQGHLPESFHVFGFARSKLSRRDFVQRIMENLTCRYAPGASCAERMEEFLRCCHYHAGAYGAADSFLDLFTRMRDLEAPTKTNRFYYLAVPPSVFLDVSKAIGDAGLVSCTEDDPWSHVVVEKPFGHDRLSSDALTQAMSSIFVESQIYRIDHYLGKEVIQNVMALRFANLVFERLWNRDCIGRIEIVWKEDLNLAGRGGYFDASGIIRDVMQNHLMQILALVTMERPRRLDAPSIAAEKVKVLRCIEPLTLADTLLGQYGPSERDDGRRFGGYVEDETVPDDSLTATFAAVNLKIDNPRWDGVPIIVSAGKGLDTQVTEVRIHFRPLPHDLFGQSADGQTNELIIRVQPDEAIQLSIANKVPGVGMNLRACALDLQYKSTFQEQIPDAYESLLLDVMRGDKSLFIRRDELEAAWDIFTPLLHEIEEKRVLPVPYEFGSTGPDVSLLDDAATRG